MAYLEIDQVTKRFGNVLAVDRVALGVERGEFVAMLGPSGCGKSTTLNMVAGFLQPDDGRIVLDGRTLNRVPVYRRDTAMVFQNYALFPHMTVFDNVAFGLRMRRVSRAEIEQRVTEALVLVRLPGLGERYPRELSGGQQQRAALARALVLKSKVLLLDEPLSNLDAKLREEMRLELRDIQQQIGITTIFVTHDIQEAFALADRIAVMNRGNLEQVGTPSEIYESPGSDFVASFVGHSNLLTGVVSAVENGTAWVTTAGGANLVIASRGDLRQHASIRIIVRPEKMVLVRAASERENHLSGQVERRTYLGSLTQYSVLSDEGRLLVMTQNRDHEALPEGTNVLVEWRKEDCSYQC